MSNTLGIIFSNIHERDIKELTSIRTLASVPFGGRYRLIDFVLSNMINSGITNIGIITKYNYQSLMDHLQSGKSWDLSRKNGGLTILPPFNNEKSRTVYSSRLEAIKNVESFIRHNPSDYILMADCDIVCNFDYAPVIAEHERRGAEITLIYRKHKVTASQLAHKRLFLDIDEDSKVKGLRNVSEGDEANVYTDFMLINSSLFLYILDHCDEWGVKSFSRDIISKCVDYRTYAYKLDGYYATISSLADYYKHSMELLDPEVINELFYKGGQYIYTKVRDSAPTRIMSRAVVKNSLIPDGCIIKGKVENSIIFRDCVIEEGVTITNSIIMQDSIIEKGSTLNCVIMDKGAHVLPGRLLSGHSTRPYYIEKDVVI